MQEQPSNKIPLFRALSSIRSPLGPRPEPDNPGGGLRWCSAWDPDNQSNEELIPEGHHGQENFHRDLIPLYGRISQSTL